MIRCANCDGEGWVCENHPEVPWLGGDGCCGGAGDPCSCNPRAEFPPGTIVLCDMVGGNAQADSD